MRLGVRLGLALGVSTGVIASCSHHDDSAPPPSSVLPGSGGTHGGVAGRGSGGTKGTAAGESGEGGATAGSSAGTKHPGHSGGSSGTGNGEAGAPETAGGGGIPYSGDMGSGGTSNGGAPGPGDGAGHIFVGPGGYDGAIGSRDAPLLTLAGAVRVAEQGDTIVFLDGSYPIPAGSDAVTIPDGVGVAADNPRFAAFYGDGGTLLELAGDSHIDGLRFDGFETAISASASRGSVSVTGVTFTNCPSASGKSVLEVGGGASVTLTDDVTHDLGDCPALGHVYGDGKLAVDGELLHFTGNGESGMFVTEDAAELDLSNLIATDGNLPLLVLGGNSTSTLATSTVQTLATHVVELHGNASLAVTSSALSLDPSVPNPDACIQTTDGAATALALEHAVLHDCEGALVGPSPKTLTVDDTEIYAMTASGLDLTGGATSSVTITASLFHDEATRAVRFGSSGAGSFDVSVSGTQIYSVASGFELDADASSTWDFGTKAAPGANVLTATTTALDVQSDAITFVAAVGNTWTPSVQGADENGQYAPASSPGVLEVTSGSGQNYGDGAGATIRLADTN